MSEHLTVGILSASDRAFRGQYEDRSGPAIEAFLGRTIASSVDTHYRLVADERERIEAALVDLADRARCAWILVSGGTGPALRDVTPEAVEAICDRRLPGFGERMRQASWDHVPTAILSRQGAAIRGRTLIVTLPGNPRAIDECLGAVFPAVPHCLELLGWPRLETTVTLRPTPHEAPRR